MPDAPEVSVVVSTYQRVALLPRLVAALEAQTLERSRFEVIITDNGSTDATTAVLERLRAETDLELHVLRAERNRGPAGGRNLGVSRARGTILAFTDDDCVPEPGWLSALLAGFAPGVDVVQGRTLPAEPVTGPLPATQQIEAFTRLYETCNIAYRGASLRRVGGFDENIGYFGEDTAAGWAVRRLGGHAVFATEAVVRHEVTYPGVAWHLRRRRRYGNYCALVRRFPEMRRELLFARVFLRPRSAAFVAALTGAGLATRRPVMAVLALPYLWLCRPRRGGGTGVSDAAVGVAYDAAIAASLVVGSAKERTLVL